MIGGALRGLFMGTVLAVLGAPLLVVLGVSLNEKKGLFFPPRGVSIKWFSQIFTDPLWFEALVASLSIAFLSAVLAISIALPISYSLWRFGTFYARALFAMGLVPFILPPVVTGLGLLIFWSTLGWIGHTENIVLGHGLFLLTLPMVMISLGLELINREWLEAAATLGAKPLFVFRTIILPAISPYVIAGFTFVFVLSMNEFIISYFLGYFTTLTLPVKIFSSLRSGYSPVVASVSVLLILVSLIAFGLLARLGDLPYLLGAKPRSIGPKSRGQ